MNTTHTQEFNNRIKRWTLEEEAIVLDNVKSFPDNLQEAFRQSARVIDRTKDAISFKYQNHLRIKHPNILSVGTPKGFSKYNTKNRANLSASQETPLAPALKPFQRIAMEMMQLPKQDLDKLLNFFK